MKKTFTLMKRILVLALSVSFGSTATAQVVISNDIATASPQIDNPYILGQTVDTNAIGIGIGRGSGITPNAGSGRYNAAGFATAALDTADYFYITVVPKPGSTLNLTQMGLVFRRSSSGPRNFLIRTSVDGFSSDYVTDTMPADTLVFSHTLAGSEFQGLTDTFTLKIYAWGGSASTGTFSVNSYAIYGTVPLPVNLLSFQGEVQNREVKLQWTAQDESYFKGYQIQRSVGNSQWEDLAFIPATNLSSLSKVQYTHLDKGANNGFNNYRLKMIDLDGAITWSEIVRVQVIAKEFSLQVYPNPAQTHIKIVGLAGAKAVRVFNTFGQVVSVPSIDEEKLDVSRLANGTYVVELSGSQGTTYGRFSIAK